MDRIRRDTLLGLVFFGTLAFLLWATINLTDLSLQNKLVVWFPEAGSVDVGTNVMVLGKKVGKVAAIDVDYERPDLPVRLELLLREEIPLKQSHSIEVRDAGVLGGKQVYIDPGRGAAIAAGGELTGRVEGSAFDRIGDIADGKGAVGESLNGALTEIRDFFRNMNDEESTIGRLVKRRDLHDSVLAAADRLNTILQAVIDGKGAVGALVMNSSTANDATETLANLRKVSDRLLTTDGTLGVLLNDRSTAMHVQAIAQNLEAIVTGANEGRGLVGRVLTDDALGERFAGIVYNLDRLLEKVNDPDAGVLGALSSDPVTGAHLKATIANLRDVSSQLARSEGLLGALINDPDLAVRFRRIMTQVSRAIEDAREAAPIGNFVQVLLGAF
jgi:phospholipid/cholesterol/gamma-HCH transport system substrate-binding protein